jgi:transcriptional regulator with XRE-family HTH domain
MQIVSASLHTTGMRTSSVVSSTVPVVPRTSGRRPARDPLSVHQVVAHNVFQARRLRGWTQEEAARAISETLGRPLTAAGVSAIEKTFTSKRQRVVDVAELAAFARAFGLPIAWFFLPPAGREGDPIPNLYEHAATLAVDVFGDDDAWAWYLARILSLIGAPRSILHDELLGSADYPDAGAWTGIDRKRDQLLRAALERFAADNSELVETLLRKLAELRGLTVAGFAESYQRNPDDPFGELAQRVEVERVEVVEGLRDGKPPQVSARYRRSRSTP